MKEIRRSRLLGLLTGPRFNGDRSAFCQTASISKGRLSQLLDPEEAFGDTAARNLCEKLTLPQGWFDAAEESAAQASTTVTQMTRGVTLEDYLEGLSGYLKHLTEKGKVHAKNALSALVDDPEDFAGVAVLLQGQIDLANGNAAKESLPKSISSRAA